MRKMKIYVCPICGNVICSTGDTVISCCGIVLPPLEAEKAGMEHNGPEGNAQARCKKNCLRKLLVFCNRDGLFDVTECIPKAKKESR